MARETFHRLFDILSSLGKVLGTWAILSTGASAAIDTVAAPADGIYDDTRALGDASRLALAQEIRHLAADLGCLVWLTATSFPTGGLQPGHQAKANRTRWSEGQPSILLAYDRASNGMVFSFSPELWNRYPAASLANLGLETNRMIADTQLKLEERLTQIVQVVAKRLRELETVRLKQSVWFPREERSSALALVGLLIGGTILAAILGLISRARSHSSGEQLLFPDVTVSTRFGAPFGGGHIAEIRTQPPAR
jgi:chemotaxis response regulator CheB